MESIKELKTEFTGKGEVRGYNFKQLKKSKYAYIYEVTGGGLRYEVFKRRVNKRFNQVSYPGANQFGITAFTTDSKEDGEKIYKRLCKEEKLRLKKRKE